MSIPKRNSSPGEVREGLRTFFVSASTDGKKALFQVAENATLLVSTIYSYRSQGKFSLHEFVVMKNHFHLLLTIDENMTIERAVQFVKGGYSFRVKKELGKTFEVWQRGYSESRVYDVASFEKHRNYIHQNPVKAGLADRPELFHYSSAFPGTDVDAAPPGLKPDNVDCLSARP